MGYEMVVEGCLRNSSHLEYFFFSNNCVHHLPLGKKNFHSSAHSTPTL